MKENTLYYFLIVISVLILSMLSKELLYSNEIIVSSLAENLTKEQIIKILNFNEKWKWITYVFIPFLLIVKISLISVVLDVGCFFFSKEIKYKKLFNIVVKAEFIFLLVIVFKTVWFYFFQADYNLEDLQYFYPLSALNIIGYEGLQPWFIYPFQVLNLFELAYWLILAYLIDKELGIDKKKDTGIKIVASSYGISLLIWVVGIMFFTLNMS
tara:strand:+ start:529 stop:1164 length:636 start_codon:yes stop_codon:yes gene_type:complete